MRAGTGATPSVKLIRAAPLPDVSDHVRVPTPVRRCTHPYKYRFYYGRGGRRDIGYDNERGKGDHRHIGQLEERYVFRSIEQLMDDFYQDIDAWRTKR